jgi:hypothetical protein
VTAPHLHHLEHLSFWPGKIHLGTKMGYGLYQVRYLRRCIPFAIQFLFHTCDLAEFLNPKYGRKRLSGIKGWCNQTNRILLLYQMTIWKRSLATLLLWCTDIFRITSDVKFWRVAYVLTYRLKDVLGKYLERRIVGPPCKRIPTWRSHRPVLVTWYIPVITCGKTLISPPRVNDCVAINDAEYKKRIDGHAMSQLLPRATKRRIAKRKAIKFW